MPSLDRLTPQTLRSRIWRPRCRYRATARWLTKFVSISLLCLSVLALVGYRLLTDPDLLRQKTIAYLERATGGDVTISRAQISLINGIEFGDVSIRPHGSTQPIFLARSLRMTSTIWTLLTRPLSETKILASEAELFLVEDTDTDQLNILQLGRSMASRDLPGDQPSTSKSLPALPQLTLRGFKLHRLQITDGKTKPLDTLAIEGQFAPQPGTGNYRYHVTTRVGPGERGPSLSGEIGIEQGRFTAKIENVELAQARLFWMQRIRSFWDRFEPSGEIGAEISIFRKPDGESGFDVTLALKDAKLKLDPDDWIGPSSGEIDPSNDLAPIWLSKVQAIFAFHDDYIEIRGLTGLLDTTTVELNAKVDGYGFDAPLTASIRTRGEPIALRISEEQAARLPDFVKNLYNMFRPQGECHIEANVWRDIAGGRIDAVGSANFINTQFTFVNFPYPVHDAKGTLRLALDEPTGERQLLLERITGRGPSDSVNANAAVHIDGIMAPLAEGSGINITIKGQNTRGDELLMKCLPEGAQQVIAQFAPLGDEKFIHCLGDFETRVIRPRGHHVRWSFDTDIYLKEGRGIFKPLNVDIETAQANIFVRSGFVDFKDVITTSHGAQAKLDGRCLFDDPDDPEHRVITRINFAGDNIAADGQHRAILPQEAQDILKNLGVSGMASVSGPITVFGDAERIDYDFNLHLTDGALRPENRSIQFTNLTADVHVRPTQTELKSITATRDDSTLIASGIVHHAGASTDYDIKGQLANLEVDADVVMSVEADQRAKVEMLKPSGRIDLDFNFTRADSKTGWAFDVAPKSLRITPDFCPVPFDVTSGLAHITLGSVELKEIVAQTGDTMLTLRGSLKADQYLLSGNVTNVSIDSDFVRALPEALSQVTKTSAKGIVDVELRSVDWKSDITKLPASESLTVDAVATLRGVSMDLGVAVSELVGTAPIVAHSENGKLTSLVGTLSAPTLLVSGLNATDGQMKIESSESARWINLKDIGFKFGGGEVAGSVTLDRSVADATKYTGELLLRDAEVKQLTTESDGTVEGRLSASLTVGGTIGGAPARGRGDLSVTGKNMLQVPMLIGLTQMVSLSLPFTSGFDQAQASYVFDGGVVNFENVMLQSREMTIRGTGQMDFETRKLDMRFYTDSNTGKLPVIGSVLEAARRELFQINVRGTLSEPTVKAGLLPTIGTSIDEVLGEK